MKGYLVTIEVKTSDGRWAEAGQFIVIASNAGIAEDRAVRFCRKERRAKRFYPRAHRAKMIEQFPVVR